MLKLAGSMLDCVDMETNDDLGENGFVVDSDLIQAKKTYYKSGEWCQR